MTGPSPKLWTHLLHFNDCFLYRFSVCSISCKLPVQIMAALGWHARMYAHTHYVCVCVHACFHIVLHDFGIS